MVSVCLSHVLKAQIILLDATADFAISLKKFASAFCCVCVSYILGVHRRLRSEEEPIESSTA